MNLQTIPREFTDTEVRQRFFDSMKRIGKVTSIDMARVARWAGVTSLLSTTAYGKLMSDAQGFSDTRQLILTTHGEEVLKEMESTALRMAISSVAPTNQTEILRSLWRLRMDTETRAYTAPVWPEPKEGYNLRLSGYLKPFVYAVMYLTGTREWHSADPSKQRMRSTTTVTI